MSDVHEESTYTYVEMRDKVEPDLPDNSVNEHLSIVSCGHDVGSGRSVMERQKETSANAHVEMRDKVEPDDMIHMGSDHTCVMAIFTISMPGKNSNHKDMKGKHDTVKRERSTQTVKSISIEMPELEKYQEIVETKKIPPPQKEMMHMIQGRTQKHKSKRENTAAEANRTLEEAEAQAQESERKNMKSSSTVANQRGVPALKEHRRQDGWTSTPCVCDDISEGREYDEVAGERLPKQRPHSIEK